jgi:hypothetical protein
LLKKIFIDILNPKLYKVNRRWYFYADEILKNSVSIPHFSSSTEKEILMTTYNRKIKLTVLACAGMLAAGSLVGLTAVKRRAGGQQQKQDYVELPQITSIIPNLEVLSASIVRQGEPNMGLALEIRNNSDQAVMAVDIASGLNGLTLNGLHDPENPKVVIEPHGTVTAEMSFSAMEKGAPLVVAAVTYADGTEEGDEASLKSMHDVRAHDKAERDAKKGAPR